ncbi:MAG: hypothetical protein ACRDSJ_16710 [Rubrobacteraceae bacterium]
MKKLMVLAATLAMVVIAASSALAQGAAQHQYDEEKPEAPGEPVTLSGVIEVLGATTFQYGSHAVTDEATGTYHALTSETVNLDEYAGERVIVHGTLVPEYEDGRIEGGPPLVEVTSVESAEGPGGDSLTGTVLEVGDGSFLFEGGDGSQIYFDITAETSFIDGVVYAPEETPPREPTASDLAPGLEVQVTPAGPIAESFPGQGEAAEVVFLSPWYDAAGDPVEKTLRGFITDVGGNSLVVSEDPNLGVEDPGYCDQAISFNLTGETEILAQQDGEPIPASAEDLREGQAVEVTYTEVPGQPEPAICPPLREADRVVILDAGNSDDGNGDDGNDGDDNGSGGGVADLLGVSVLPDTGGTLLPALGFGVALVAGGLLVRRIGR